MTKQALLESDVNNQHHGQNCPANTPPSKPNVIAILPINARRLYDAATDNTFIKHYRVYYGWTRTPDVIWTIKTPARHGTFQI